MKTDAEYNWRLRSPSEIQVQVAQALYEREIFYGSLGSALQLSSENFKWPAFLKSCEPAVGTSAKLGDHYDTVGLGASQISPQRAAQSRTY